MNLGLVLDIVMVGLLSGTIYFAWTLSNQMTRFRNARADMDRLVRDLNGAVERAQGAIIALRDTAEDAGDELHRAMRGATELSDELQLMTESANAVAGRLEAAATSRAAPASPVTPFRMAEPSEADSLPRFAIRDPEFDGSVAPDDEAAWSFTDDLPSEAERELARAMAAHQKQGRSVM